MASHYQKLVIAQNLPTILMLFRYFASFKISQKKLEVTVKKKNTTIKTLSLTLTCGVYILI